MFPKLLPTLLLLTVIACLASCSSRQTSPTPGANMPNPASVHCEQNGGKLELRQDAAGGVSGRCVFSDGSQCDEWAFFRNECQPGRPPEAQTAAAPTAAVPASTAEAASDSWKIYRNAELGYSFQYPADAKIITNDDPLKSISIIGPQIDGESWPSITISHPRDRAEYRPPAGADLLQWLTDHNLLGDVHMPDTQIASTTAIHLRHSRSPQSYAYDRYYFARSGQLYMVVIGHTGDKEDWDLYNRFLDSLRFDQA